MFYLFLFLFFSSLIAPSSTTEFFTKGQASAGSRYLAELADDFDRERVNKERTIIAPSPQPIHKQLQNIDENLTATTGDIAAIFKTILTLRHNQQPFIAPEKTANELLSKQFMAYQIMDIACQSLLEKPISLAELKEKTIIKTHEQESLRHFSDAYITSLIPDTAVTMIQYPEPSREINYLRLHGQPKSQLYTEHQWGVLLGNYDRKKTFEALRVEKDQNKAIYLVLGRGNRQPAPEDQKTADGRNIVWVYLDKDAQYHSVNSKEYFLWEDFNGFLRDKLPDNFFDAVIFDEAVVKFMDTEMLTVYQIMKILKDDGFLIFESTFNGGGLPVLIYTTSEYEISSTNWPALRKVYCRGCGELIKEQQRRELYQKWYKDFIKALEDAFSYLFKKVEKVTADENLGFQLAQYGSSEERPTFKLTEPKKDLKGILTTYYWPETLGDEELS